MSGVTGSNTETVYVRLLDEGVDVWRPVSARRLGPDLFELSTEASPEDEIWEFAPGSRVVVETRRGPENTYPVAVAAAGLVAGQRRWRNATG